MLIKLIRHIDDLGRITIPKEMINFVKVLEEEFKGWFLISFSLDNEIILKPIKGEIKKGNEENEE